MRRIRLAPEWNGRQRLRQSWQNPGNSGRHTKKTSTAPASGGKQILDSRSDRPLAAQRPSSSAREKAGHDIKAFIHTRPRGTLTQAQTDVESRRLSRNQTAGMDSATTLVAITADLPAAYARRPCGPPAGTDRTGNDRISGGMRLRANAGAVAHGVFSTDRPER